ncbi:protein farnesyltransferase [Ascoidea rubescens DSM 1968]|uniref:Protein farnesyltransferase subunit beta n=1 Tax=Ascoidea rubescens DSM 1968 TaxID=1344418 RepID=A0A1D2VEK5_9ASCO|nr:terpenoid cyclases/Protein prenyltransferase [Ascoidea rubescens DSM 1968]ODV59933.1 terpenoid cyclases/Protein prenyltransferase [Ascoidea rubescens DSM 1968]
MEDINDEKTQQIGYILSLLGKRKKEPIFNTVLVDRDYQLENLLTMMNFKDSPYNIDNDSDLFTKTLTDQREVENSVIKIYKEFLNSSSDNYESGNGSGSGSESEGENGIGNLKKSLHLKFLKNALKPLNPAFTKLDASQTWIVFWIVNSLLLLDQDYLVKNPELNEQICLKIGFIVDYNKESKSEKEYQGIGGGVGQLGHIASTYAAIMSLSFTKRYDVWERIPRKSIYDWMLNELKQKDGSFVMSRNGEKDVRAVYCALTVGSVLNILSKKLVENTAKWIQSCQTYEGGFGGCPDNEAHGGYTYCAVASLCLLGDPKDMLNKYCNLDALVRWIVSRQYNIEGGLSGRTNKLVDSCYSHWVGSLAPFIEIAIEWKTIMSRNCLQNYILLCCQNRRYGGLRDKPLTNPDYYHTNYALCGLSVCQNVYLFNYKKFEESGRDFRAVGYCYEASGIEASDVVERFQENSVSEIHPVFGTVNGYAQEMYEFFCGVEIK